MSAAERHNLSIVLSKNQACGARSAAITSGCAPGARFLFVGAVDGLALSMRAVLAMCMLDPPAARMERIRAQGQGFQETRISAMSSPPIALHR